MQTAPKYSKVELVLNEPIQTKTHTDCGMVISGNKLIIVEDTNDSIHNTQVTEGIVYDLDNISRYRTYKS
jgi:hypothetical protein